MIEKVCVQVAWQAICDLCKMKSNLFISNDSLIELDWLIQGDLSYCPTCAEKIKQLLQKDG
jgi:hypothetical protein